MCQILLKPQNYDLRRDLLESTCITNADGFGYMYFDEDQEKVVARKHLRLDARGEGDNDPDEIQEILKDVTDKEAFLHFRFATAGTVSEPNCHPFLAYTDFDRELWVMHNGTMSDFKKDNRVDSEVFAAEFAGPLYGTFLKSGVSDPLQDSMYQKILKEFVGFQSKVVLLDSQGSTHIVNYSTGFDFEDKENQKEFWVSNIYSFNRAHRTPAKTNTWPVNNTYHDGKWGHWSHGVFHPEVKTNTSSFSSGGTGTTDTPFGRTSSTTPSVQGGTKTNTAETSTSGTNETTKTTKKEREIPNVPQQVQRLSYWKDVLELDSIDDLQGLTSADIEELVDSYPENAKLLISDLLIELLETAGTEE